MTLVNKDDVEIRPKGNKIGYQSVDPVTREPTGPLRSIPEDAQADDEQAFIKKQRKVR